MSKRRVVSLIDCAWVCRGRSWTRRTRLSRFAVCSFATVGEADRPSETSPRELESVLVRPSGLVQMQPLELRTSAEGPPTVLLHVARSTFTSVCLPLMKPG